MIVTIQAVPERLEHIKTYVLPVEDTSVHVDWEKRGNLWSFYEMLKITVPTYRLHLQDDVILARELHQYFPRLERMMDSGNIHVLSLYAPNRTHINNALIDPRKPIYPFPNFLWLQGTIFSRSFVQIMRDEQGKHNTMHDDGFVSLVLKKYRIPAHVHIPGLVQHDLSMESTMKHLATKTRESPRFDPDFIVNHILKP